METKTKSFVAVAKIGDIPEGGARSFEVAGHRILVARVGVKYYAADSTCPHIGATNLADGKLQGTILTCPRHASKFDLVDGRVVRWADWTGVKAPLSRLFTAPRPLATHQTRVEGDDILVEV